MTRLHQPIPGALYLQKLFQQQHHIGWLVVAEYFVPQLSAESRAQPWLWRSRGDVAGAPLSERAKRKG